MNASMIMKQVVIYIIPTGAILHKYFYVWYFKYIFMAILLYWYK